MGHKQKRYLLWAILILVECACVVCGYFVELWKGVYLYPVAIPFGEYFGGSLWLILLMFLPLDLLIFFLFKFWGKKEKMFRILKAVMLVLLCVSCLLLPVTFGFLQMGVWHSQTDEVDHYSRIDPALSRQVQLGEEDISTLMAEHTGEVLSYQYEYRSVIAMEYFNIYYAVKMEPSAYDALKQAYEKNALLSYEACAEFQTPDGIVQVDGLWRIDESQTNVDEVTILCIAYCDASHTIYVWLNGDCYT